MGSMIYVVRHLRIYHGGHGGRIERNMNVFITGATAGFGKACAMRFAAEGHNLIVAGRRTERLSELASELKGKIEIYPLTLDVQNREDVLRAIETLPVQFQEIDILVNNAGLALGLSPAHAAELDEWEQMVDTNIKGVLYCTRAVLPGMVARNRGHIINIGSVAGSSPYPGGNTYGATKAFVAQFTKNLKCDLFGTAVRVTNIEPGLAETEFSLVRFKGDTERAKKTYANAQALRAEDIAEAVYWVTTQPAHVNINSIEMMPTCQAWGAFGVDRKTE
jgi:3-hydroxy acid dehydrogenase/malonic semialdehyde reductase